MKNILIVTAFILAFHTHGIAQQTTTASVEKSVYNMQTGFLGIYLSDESRLGNRFALRTELGLDAVFSVGSDVAANSGLAPSLNIEPRWYYNLYKRERKGRNISNNSANFVTVSVKLLPDLFVIGNKNLVVPNQLLIIPKWGIRRNIGNSNFNYEAGIGLGYYKIFDNKKYFISNPSEAALDIHLRIGYTF